MSIYTILYYSGGARVMKPMKIRSVYYTETEDAAIILELRLYNGLTLFFPVIGKELDPRFQDIVSRRFRGMPNMDEQCIYWENGARLNIREIWAALESGLRRGGILKAETADSWDKLSVRLDNGILITLPLALKRSDPLFSEIMELPLPETDGARVYWRNSASLSSNDILELLQQ